MTRKHSDSKKPEKSGANSQRKIGRREFLATSGAVTGAAILGGLPHAAVSNSGSSPRPESSQAGTPWIAPKTIPVHHGWAAGNTVFYQTSANDPEYLEVFGYCDAQSYKPGDTVRLHISTTAPTFDLEIYRDGSKPETVYKKEGIRGKFTPTPEDAYENGCNWPVLHELTIPSDWRSGAYIVVLRVEKDGVRRENEAFFVLRGTGKVRVAYLLPTCTWIAYNSWGGGNHYWGVNGAAPILSLSRPWERGFIVAPPYFPYQHSTPDRMRYEEEADFAGMPYTAFPFMNGLAAFGSSAGWAVDNRPFAIWAEENGYEMEYLDQTDLEAGPQVLEPYDLVIITAHDEYWSWKQRDALDAFLENGGKLARFAANMLWQVRIEDGRQISYKYDAEEKDPVRNDPKRRHLLTGVWDNRLVKRPAAQTFGVTGLLGVFATTESGARRSHGGFTVYRPNHWVFEGTGLGYGDSFGDRQGIVGYEIDGLDYIIEYGLPRPTDRLGALEGTEILALTPGVVEPQDKLGSGMQGGGEVLVSFFAHSVEGKDDEESRRKYRYGSGQIVVAPKGKGEIFCAGTIYWFLGLKWRDRTVERITHNVLQRYTRKA